LERLLGQPRPQISELPPPEIFSDSAGFSGIADTSKSKEGLKITDVFHKAFIAVDEEGTEAAAATAVVVAPTSAPPTAEAHIDRPFLFLIRDQTTGNILFMGRVVDPTK